MAHITADRVRQTSTSTGTGTIVLSASLTGFRDFSSVLATSDTFWYAIASLPGSEWEVGLGTWGGSNTFTRTTVLASSNAGSAVVFSAGTKEVFITAAASKFLQQDSAGSYGNFTAGTITAALTGAASSNVLKTGDTMTGGLVTTIGGGVANSTKHIALTNGTNYDIFFSPRATAGSYNTLTQAGDALIGFSAGAIDTGDLVIGPWSASGKGIRIDAVANTVTIGATSVSPAATNTQTLGASGLLWSNVYATTFTGALTGNASTATALETSRTLWGQAFTGAANVTGNLTSVGSITGTGAVTLTATSGTLALAATGANTITASTNSTTRLTITAAGDVGIGTTATTAQSLGINKNITGGATAIPLMNNGAIQADVTGAAWMFRSSPSVVASAFTLPTLAHFSVVAGTLGASSTITNEYGALFQNTMVNATNIYGVSSNIVAQVTGGTVVATATSISQNAATVTVNATAHGFVTGQYVTVAATANATSLVSGAWVTILTLGTTDFTLLGAASNTIGVSFTVNAVTPLGTGTVTLNAQGSGKSITVVDANSFTYTTTSATYTAITLLTGVITPATRWNIYAGGTAANYFAGSVGIGNTSISNVNLRLGKTIVGAGGTSGWSIYNGGTVQTDVTNAAYYHYTNAVTAGAVTNIYHHTTSQGTFGGAVTGQLGYISGASLIGATNNYAFYADNTAAVTTGKAAYGFVSAINTATGGGTTWNFYANGTAANYFAGEVGIGANPVGSTAKLFLGGTLTGGATRISVRSQHTFQSDVTLAVGYSSAPITQATAYTLANLFHFRVDDVTLGSTSAVTNQFGMYVAPLVNATANFAFYADNSVAVGSTRTSYGFYSNNNIATGGGATYNFYAAGTAVNYFAGAVGIGNTTPSTYGKFVSQSAVNGTTVVASFNNISNVSANTVVAVDLWADQAQSRISSNRDGGGTSSSLIFSTANASTLTEKMRIDAAGNIGINGAPGTWATAAKALEFTYPTFGMDGNGAAFMSFNARNSTGTTWLYKSTDEAAKFTATAAGGFNWETAASGTAGNAITFNQVMTLDSSGNLTPGTTNTQTLGAVGDVWSNVHATTVTATFHESAQTISTNYTITAGNNAMTPGPITIASGVTVTVPSGSVWTIV
jgi:hypothetical protein